MRLPLLLVWVVLYGCGSASLPPASSRDGARGGPTAEAWYAQTVDELAGSNRRARELVQQSRSDDASALILKGQPLIDRLLSVSQPTLEAMAAISDRDELYGKMLLSNGNYGWARLLFQKNLVRWKYWNPKTPEAEARLKQAEAAIAECDRRIEGEAGGKHRRQ